MDIGDVSYSRAKYDLFATSHQAEIYQNHSPFQKKLRSRNRNANKSPATPEAGVTTTSSGESKKTARSKKLSGGSKKLSGEIPTPSPDNETSKSDEDIGSNEDDEELESWSSDAESYESEMWVVRKTHVNILTTVSVTALIMCCGVGAGVGISYIGYESVSEELRKNVADKTAQLERDYLDLAAQITKINLRLQQFPLTISDYTQTIARDKATLVQIATNITTLKSEFELVNGLEGPSVKRIMSLLKESGIPSNYTFNKELLRVYALVHPTQLDTHAFQEICTNNLTGRLVVVSTQEELNQLVNFLTFTKVSEYPIYIGMTNFTMDIIQQIGMSNGTMVNSTGVKMLNITQTGETDHECFYITKGEIHGDTNCTRLGESERFVCEVLV